MIYLFLIFVFLAFCVYISFKDNKKNSVDNDVPIYNVRGSKNEGKDILKSIFRIAEKGADHFKMPLSKEGQLELLMFDVWFCLQSLDSKGIFLDYDDTQKRIEDYLIGIIRNFGMPSEKKYERVYLLRCVTEGWERDMFGLAQSDYPRTKQYLPAYLYMCIIKEPLKIYADDILYSKIDSLRASDLADFFMVYIEHHDWLVTELRKI